MEGNRTILDPPELPTSGRGVAKTAQVFSFGETVILGPPDTIDKSYWSAGAKTDPDYASQETLFDDLGVDLLNHAFDGFNTCIFACKYGRDHRLVSGRTEKAEANERRRSDRKVSRDVRNRVGDRQC